MHCTGASRCSACRSGKVFPLVVPLLLVGIAVAVGFTLLFDHYSWVRPTYLQGRCFPSYTMLYQPLMAKQQGGEGMAIRGALAPWVVTWVLLAVWLLTGTVSVILIWYGLVYMEQTYNVVAHDLESEVGAYLVQVHICHDRDRL